MNRWTCFADWFDVVSSDLLWLVVTCCDLLWRVLTCLEAGQIFNSQQQSHLHKSQQVRTSQGNKVISESQSKKVMSESQGKKVITLRFVHFLKPTGHKMTKPWLWLWLYTHAHSKQSNKSGNHNIRFEHRTKFAKCKNHKRNTEESFFRKGNKKQFPNAKKKKHSSKKEEWEFFSFTYNLSFTVRFVFGFYVCSSVELPYNTNRLALFISDRFLSLSYFIH